MNIKWLTIRNHKQQEKTRLRSFRSHGWIKIPLTQNLEAGQKQLGTADYIKIKNKKVCIIKYYIQSKNINELSPHAANTSRNMVDVLRTWWTVY